VPVNFWKSLYKKHSNSSFKKQLKAVLGYSPGDVFLYKTALTHRSVKETSDENNERLEYLGDAILSAIVADYLFKRYPYKEEGFLTEMRSKMVNRQQLNEIAVKMGLKKITVYNKSDSSLKVSQIFGNTLEALVGAIYLDKGYKKTVRWVSERIVIPHMFVDDLEILEINHKNKLYGWANKNGKLLEFETMNEQLENGRRLFTIAAVINGKVISEGKAFNKKDASQIAAQLAVEKLGIANADSPGTFDSYTA
jgi:ribonuclease-3